MSGKLTSNNLFRALIALSIFLYIISRAALVFFLNSAINNLWSSKAILSQITENKILYLLYYIIIDVLPFAITAVLLTSIVKRLISETRKKSESEFTAIISEQQKEIAKQNKLITNLTNLYNDAVEYNNVKADFFSNISHELKTPLSVILGAIQLIDQKNSFSAVDNTSVSKHFRTIKQNCYRLVRLINNILDISRIESGYIRMNLSNCNIVYLVEEMAQSIAPYAEQKNLSLEFDTEFEEITTAVDIDKIERIILNLLSNAIKFTPSGGKISVKVKGMNERVFISIKDTGPGIPREMQSMIFERFKQVSNSFTREFEGTGIGLSLVKCFVELHDGGIEIKSEERKGSEFIIELPVKLTEGSNDSVSTVHTAGQSKIIEAINIEFSDIYSIAS
jgi:two-component system, cell cycle sensor histidine kinase PleC